jgi:hypothetical protein
MLFLYIMNLRIAYLACAVTILTFVNTCIAQVDTKPDKVSHAEPLYLDLVRDLGARKGEKEINIGADFSNSTHYNTNAFLIEYEFAPINRLGLEVEADFSFYKRIHTNSETPGNKLECLRFSTQYSFFVSTKLQTTMALGYTQIAEFTAFKNYGKADFMTGTVYNPFFIAAKRWGKSFHSLSYISPMLEHTFATNALCLNWQINTSFHYVIPQTKHFIGVELNKEFHDGVFCMTIRPQVKMKLSPKVALGLVTGIPVINQEEGYSSFVRIIYEP